MWIQDPLIGLQFGNLCSKETMIWMISGLCQCLESVMFITRAPRSFHDLCIPNKHVSDVGHPKVDGHALLGFLLPIDIAPKLVTGSC